MKKNLNRIDKDAQEELANGCKQLQARLSELDARELSELYVILHVHVYCHNVCSIDVTVEV